MDFSVLPDLLFELGVSLGGKLIASLIVLIIGIKLIKMIKKWLTASKKLSRLDDGVRSFAASFAGIALYIILFITIAMMLGIPTTSFITALASCGVAIGLAMQGTLSNFAGGIMILLFKPFKVGDYIETADASGTVSEITVVYTVLCTPDNKVITIPNGNLTNSVIENYSAVENRRVDLTFTASYGCDVDKVKNILMTILEKHPLILKDPAPFARLSEHGDNALTYTVRVWCNTEHYWDVKFDILEEVKKEFDKNNIELAINEIKVELNK